MFRFMYSGISGMNVNQTKLDVIGNNIANVSTTAFKCSDTRFKDMIYQNAGGDASAPTSSLGGTNARQVGLGAQVSSIDKSMGQGNALATGRTLDNCIDGDGYFVVAKGDVTGQIDVDQNTGMAPASPVAATGTLSETLFTRDGNFKVDYAGNLITSDGHRIMGYYFKQGSNTSLAWDAGKKEWKATKVDADQAFTPEGGANSKATEELRPLAIPDSVYVGTNKKPVTGVNIGKNGLITVTLGDGSRSVIGQVALAGFKNPEGLVDQGGNFAINSSNSGPIVYQTVIGCDPTVDNSKGYGGVVSGALEGSNVDLTKQFTDMITATRSFQASSKLISTGDEILQTITGLIR